MINIIDTINKRLETDGSSAVFETIGSQIYDQFVSDDESLKNKGCELWRAYLRNPNATDDVLIALCGWSMRSLLVFAGLIEDAEGVLLT